MFPTINELLVFHSDFDNQTQSTERFRTIDIKNLVYTHKIGLDFEIECLRRLAAKQKKSFHLEFKTIRLI